MAGVAECEPYCVIRNILPKKGLNTENAPKQITVNISTIAYRLRVNLKKKKTQSTIT